LGACRWEQPGSECGTQIVGRPSNPENTALGKAPPVLGRIAGFLPAVRAIEAAAHCAQGCSASSRVA
jgi:hypothetical protein